MLGKVLIDFQLRLVNDHLAHILQVVQLGQLGIGEDLVLLAVFIQHHVLGNIRLQVPLSKQVFLGDLLILLCKSHGKKQHSCRDSRKQPFHTVTQSFSSLTLPFAEIILHIIQPASRHCNRFTERETRNLQFFHEKRRLCIPVVPFFFRSLRHLGRRRGPVL